NVGSSCRRLQLRGYRHFECAGFGVEGSVVEYRAQARLEGHELGDDVRFVEIVREQVDRARRVREAVIEKPKDHGPRMVAQEVVPVVEWRGAKLEGLCTVRAYGSVLELVVVRLAREEAACEANFECPLLEEVEGEIEADLLLCHEAARRPVH